MTDIEGIGIDLEIKTDKVKKGLEQIGVIAEKSAQKVETAFRGANQKIGNMGETARKNAIPAIKQLAKESQKSAAISKKAFNQSSKAVDGVRKSTIRARKSVAAYNRQLEATKKKAAGAAKGTAFITKNLKKLASAAAAIFFVRKFTQATDAILKFRGTLKALLTDSEDVLPIIEKQMLSMAVTAGVSFGSTAKLFNRIAIIKDDLQASNKEILTFVGNVQKIGVATGASAEGLKFGTVQLAQGLTSGVFRAEELNSILENIPGVAKAIAENMSLSVAQMRQMVLNGELMSQDVFDALKKDSEKYNKNLEQMPLTWDRAGARASVAFTAIAAKIEDATGLSETFANIWANIFTETAFATGALRPIERIEEEIKNLERFNSLTRDMFGTGFARRKRSDQITELRDEIKAIQEAAKELEKKNALNADGLRISAQEAEAAKTLMKLKVAQVKITESITEQNKKAVELGFLAPELALKGVEVDKKRLEIINQIIALEKQLAEDKAKKKITVPDFAEVIIKPDPKVLKALRESASLIAENATATEKLAAFKQKLVDLMPELIELTGSEAKANEVAATATDNFAKSLDKVDAGVKKTTKLAEGFGNAFGSAFEDAILKAESLSKVLKGLANDILRLIIRQTISIPIASAITGALKGGNASGGTINGPTLVGERGPEIFNPRGPGSILNNAASKKATGGQGGNIINVTNNVGPQNDVFAAVSVVMETFKQQMMQDQFDQRQGIVR